MYFTLEYSSHPLTFEAEFVASSEEEAISQVADFITGNKATPIRLRKGRIGEEGEVVKEY